MPPHREDPDPDPSERAPESDGYPPRPAGTVRIGTLAGAPVLVSGSWFLVAGMIAIIFAPLVERVQPDLGLWRYVVGLLFAVVLYGSVLLHEASHAWMAKRYGYHIESVTLHFLGGATQIDRESRTPREEFWIAFVGPVTSLGVGGVALGVYHLMPESLIGVLVQALAMANLIVGVTNLLPALPLDGGRVLKAGVWQATGNVHRGTMVAAWGGRVLAALILCWPVYELWVLQRRPSTLSTITIVVLAVFLWTSASAFLANARIRERLPRLVARAMARRAVLVEQSTSLAEAIRLAQVDQAGSIITCDATGAPVGVVKEAALVAVPDVRRAWVPVSSVARSLDQGLILPADISGEALVLALSRRPASEYLLVEADGSLLGVLVTADVDQAFREAHN